MPYPDLLRSLSSLWPRNAGRSAALILSGFFVGSAADAGDSALCKDHPGWSSATYVSATSVETQSSASIQRYSDGARVDLQGPGEDKTFIMLETGEQIFRGTRSGSQDFTSADIAAGGGVYFLQKKFPTPCDAARSTGFDLELSAQDRSSGGAEMVKGTIRAEGNSLEYTLRLYSSSSPGPERTIHGKWSVEAISPIPPATVITGWSFQQNGLSPVETITAHSLGELLASGGARKQ